MSSAMLQLPFENEGTEKVVVKKTFIEVVEDITPKGLPPTYNSDSVIISRFGRQFSGKSVVDEDEPSAEMQFSDSEDGGDDADGGDGAAEELPTLLGRADKAEEQSGPKCLLISSFLHDEEESNAAPRVAQPPDMYRRSLDLLVQYAMAHGASAAGAAPAASSSVAGAASAVSAATAATPVGATAAMPEAATTVMLRNLPNNYTRTMVCTMMDKEGFKGHYDFLYLPIDFRSKANLGYAFVNLVSEADVQSFWKVFDGYTRWVLPSAKVCSVSWSGPHQGQQAHVDRYKDSPIMHSSVPDEFKPVIFAAGSGERQAFPPPSKKLRAPRRRPGQGHGNDSKPAS